MVSSAKANAGGGPTPIPSDPEKAGRTTYARSGATVIGLYMPFAVGDKQIEEVSLMPFDYGLTLRWRKGEFQSSTTLLLALCDGIDEPTLMKIKYPDMDRIMFAFINSLPSVVRDDIMQGTFPPPPVSEFTMAELTGEDETGAIVGGETFDPNNYPEPTRRQQNEQAHRDEQQPVGTAGTGFDLEG
jgi:hypothetical protein